MLDAIIDFLKRLLGIGKDHPAYLEQPSAEQAQADAQKYGADTKVFDVPPTVGQNGRR